jgi:hypothetical protein
MTCYQDGRYRTVRKRPSHCSLQHANNRSPAISVPISLSDSAITTDWLLTVSFRLDLFACEVLCSCQSISCRHRHIVDVKEIIGEMTVLLRVEADRHSITIHPELEADTPKILANRVQLQQVFMNLMLNAIEAMKDTKVV